MSWLEKHGGNEDLVLRFLQDLERLAASMLIRRMDINGRIERYGRLLGEIENGSDLFSPLSVLQLTEAECASTLDALDKDLYLSTRVRLYALLRLDSELSSGGATYDYPTITIEHVLPQNIEPGSEWARNFSLAEHQRWVHRVANLVLLTRRKNSQASNFDFEKKKRMYFMSSSGTSPFALTSQVPSSSSWDEEVLKNRQERLLLTLSGLWRLT